MSDESINDYLARENERLSDVITELQEDYAALDSVCTELYEENKYLHGILKKKSYYDL
jgi:hypothetical protein